MRMSNKDKKAAWVKFGGKYKRTCHGFRYFNRNEVEVSNELLFSLEPHSGNWVRLLNEQPPPTDDEWHEVANKALKERNDARASYSRMAQKHARVKAQLQALEQYVMLSKGVLICDEDQEENVPF